MWLLSVFSKSLVNVLSYFHNLKIFTKFTFKSQYGTLSKIVILTYFINFSGNEKCDFLISPNLMKILAMIRSSWKLKIKEKIGSCGLEIIFEIQK